MPSDPVKMLCIHSAKKSYDESNCLNLIWLCFFFPSVYNLNIFEDHVHFQVSYKIWNVFRKKIMILRLSPQNLHPEVSTFTIYILITKSTSKHLCQYLERPERTWENHNTKIALNYSYCGLSRY